MKTSFALSGTVAFLSFLLLTACGSPEKNAGECTDADCARATTSQEDRASIKAEPAAQKSAPGTITVICGVFKDNEEAATPCDSVVIKVFQNDSAKPKAVLTLSGDKLVVPNISAKETITLNLMLKGCAKANLLPGLKSGDTRETYFKLPCK